MTTALNTYYMSNIVCSLRIAGCLDGFGVRCWSCICLLKRAVQSSCSLPAAVLAAVWGATTDCVGGAAINLARSESAMFPADAA